LRALIFHTRSISILEGELSTRPIGIRKHSEQRQDLHLENVAAAFVCIEKGDRTPDSDVIRNEIVEYASRVNRKVLLIPFAHLSSTAAAPAKARSMLTKLSEQLSDRRLLAGAAGFGSHKVLKIADWVTKAHPGDVAFRDSRFESSFRPASANGLIEESSS
jgi:hypothetical protein